MSGLKMLTWIVYVSCSIILIAQCYEITDDELMEDFYPDTDNIQTDFVTKCFGDLGCFYTGPPFYHPTQRVKSVPPANDTDAKFYLYTPDNPNEKYELVPTKGSLVNSRFNESYPLKVLIHGASQKELSIFFKMKDELLRQGRYNVIIVNWILYDSLHPPWQTLANGRLVAAIIARLLNFLMRETRLESRDIHVIAHSMGSHVAGWVGERIEKLGRISGLDPSGVGMHGAPPSIRLDFTDALFVDVLHTNGGRNLPEGIAFIDPIGQINFYPNGGEKQPGCPVNQPNATTVDEFMDSCNHNRAAELYLATINSSKCQYLAVECSSWEEFKAGDCLPSNSRINEMGFHAKNIPGVPYASKFYLETGSKYPFCKSNKFIDRSS